MGVDLATWTSKGGRVRATVEVAYSLFGFVKILMDGGVHHSVINPMKYICRPRICRIFFFFTLFLICVVVLRLVGGFSGTATVAGRFCPAEESSEGALANKKTKAKCDQKIGHDKNSKKEVKDGGVGIM